MNAEPRKIVSQSKLDALEDDRHLGGLLDRILDVNIDVIHILVSHILVSTYCTSKSAISLAQL